jgi:choice-of-anchor C domain-containing protein
VASDSVHAVDLNGRDSIGSGIEQTFATLIGEIYSVSFDLSGNPEGLPQVKQVRVAVDGVSQDYSHDSLGQATSALIWESLGFSFIASGTSATLSFTSLTPQPNSYGALIDNVSVIDTGSASSVPEPSTLLLLGSGLVANASRWRRKK